MPREKIIYIIILLGFPYAYLLLSTEGLLLSLPANMMRDPGNFSYYLLRYLLPVPALILLCLQKQAGWFLTVVYASLCAVLFLALGVRELCYAGGLSISGLLTRLAGYLVLAALHISALLKLGSEDIRYCFKQTRRTFIELIVISSLLTVAGTWYLWA